MNSIADKIRPAKLKGKPENHDANPANPNTQTISVTRFSYTRRK